MSNTRTYYADPTNDPATDAAKPASGSGEGRIDLVGRNLRHFRIDKRIAAGGMGEVYLGFDTSLSRPVAIKTIKPQLVAVEGFLLRFTREATAQANVVHPHVVQVYFIGEDQGVWFIAMQVVDGGSLGDLVKREERMSWQDAARHMIALVDGLTVAARLGIVHRDIKPANILVDSAGNALLADFGLATAAGAKDDAPTGQPGQQKRAAKQQQLQLTRATEFGVVMGTPDYVAPEQLTSATLDERADMYALAATFYHLMTGKPPIEALTLSAAMAAHKLNEPVPSVAVVASDVPRAFAAILDRCLSRDRDQRFATMADLLVALRRAGPQPEVKPAVPVRVLVWLLDVVPFLLVARLTTENFPFVAPLLFLLAGLLGAFAMHSTPGIWLMRLRLRTSRDGDVVPLRGFARFLLQHGWFVPASLTLSALHRSTAGANVAGAITALWLLASLAGALPLVLGAKQALHDKLTGTRVLVDVRA